MRHFEYLVTYLQRLLRRQMLQPVLLIRNGSVATWISNRRDQLECGFGDIDLH